MRLPAESITPNEVGVLINKTGNKFEQDQSSVSRRVPAPHPFLW